MKPIPSPIKEEAIDLVEGAIFPKPAKTIWGKIARIGFKIAKFFAVKKLNK